MIELRQCPLCGGKVEAKPYTQLYSTDQNMYAEKILGSVRVIIRCKKCNLYIDKVHTDEYTTIEKAEADFERVTDDVIKLWNRRAK